MKEQLSSWRWAVGGIFLSAALGVGLWGVSTSDVLADRGNYEREHDDHDESHFGRQRSPNDPLYVEECGACHLAYPPQLLGSNSWQAIMTGLDDHFGENAEIDSPEQTQITAYLSRYAADNSGYKNQRYIAKNGTNSVTLRITELPFFTKEHDEVPTRMVEGNEQVGSFSQCDSCHHQAVQGSFDEDEVAIPGYGRWED
ncbi:MAG: diheme cytochrome c [Halopseudomonas sp.]